MADEPTGRIFGYARVSSTDQNAERQVVALVREGIDKSAIYIDHKSGKDFNRPAWRKLVRKAKPGDVIVITSLDRFGRNYEEMQNQWRELVKKRRVHIRVLDMPLLDTTAARGLLSAFTADLVLQILAFVAQAEREHIRERQRQGIAAAKARGVHFGRPKKTLPESFGGLAEQVRCGQLSLRQAARQCDISPTTFSKYMSS